MATGTQLDRIAALADQLHGLAGKSRGMPIEADEWNSLVGALQGILEVDRVQESTGQASLELSFARADHDHIGQVVLTWLDPDLQARLGDASNPVSTRAAVADLAHRIQGLSGQVAQQTSAVETMQSAADHSAADDLERDAKLRGFEGRLGGLDDLKGLVGTLNGQIDGITANVQTVLELRSALSDAAGNPIDVAGLQQQVQDLRALKDQLAGVDGQPLRLRDLELKIEAIQGQVGGGAGGGLDDRFAQLSSGLEAKFDADLQQRDDRLHTDLRTATDDLRTQLTAQQQTSEASLRSDVEASTDQKIASTRSETADETGLAIAAGVDQAKADALAQATSMVDDKLAGVPAQVQAGVAAARNDIQTAVTADVTKQVSARVHDEVLAQVQAQVKAQLDAVNLTGMVGQEVSSQIAAADLGGDVRTEVESQLASTDLPGMVRREIAGQLDSRNLPDIVRGEVQSQVSAANLVGLVQNEVTVQLRRRPPGNGPVLPPG